MVDLTALSGGAMICQILATDTLMERVEKGAQDRFLRSRRPVGHREMKCMARLILSEFRQASRPKLGPFWIRVGLHPDRFQSIAAIPFKEYVILTLPEEMEKFR